MGLDDRDWYREEMRERARKAAPTRLKPASGWFRFLADVRRFFRSPNALAALAAASAAVVGSQAPSFVRHHEPKSAPLPVVRSASAPASSVAPRRVQWSKLGGQ